MILIKAVIDALPLYWLALYHLPKGITLELEKLKRKFYWREIGETMTLQRKLHMVNWATISSDKSRGGLSIQRLEKKNVAMLAKWWWKAKTDTGKLWYSLLRAKYGEYFLSAPRIARNDISLIL